MESNNMIILKSFSREIDAEVAVAYLESQGIETLIKKDDCGGNYPQLQLSSGVQLLINSSDEQAARSILNEIDSEQSSKQVPEPTKTKKGTTMLVIGFLLIGVWLGYFMSSKVREYRTASGQSRDMIEVDTNGDGKPDIFYYYTNRQLILVEADRNYDGIIDAWHHYNNGKIVSSEYDDNFDGKLDAWAKYENDNNYVVEVDTDFNGISDSTIYYANQLQSRRDWHPNGSTIIVKREIFKNGNKQQEYIDLDKDGRFDIRVDFDAFGNEVQRIKLPVITGQ
jgi:hypothetical protein